MRVTQRGVTMRRVAFFIIFGLTISLAPFKTDAQQRGGGRGGAPQPPATAKAGAPIDLTGYWVSLVTEDWRYRMFTPRKGDYQGLPLNQAARQIADAWDPAKDETAGDQCKSYGAANIMRVPERIHITWQDDQTMKIETDAGMQTRLLYFGNPEGQGGTWQGLSKASWDDDAGFGVRNELFDRAFGTVGGRPKASSMKIVTTKLKPGYIRKNGVPYSANAVVTEYFDQVKERNGDTYLIITTTVEDPTYFTMPYYTSSNFRKLANASGWNPSPCASR
jgi:hypothetical protein